MMRKFDGGDGGDGTEEPRYEIKVKKLWWEAREYQEMIEWENSCFVLMRKFDARDGGDELPYEIRVKKL